MRAKSNEVGKEKGAETNPYGSWIVANSRKERNQNIRGQIGSDLVFEERLLCENRIKERNNKLNC